MVWSVVRDFARFLAPVPANEFVSVEPVIHLVQTVPLLRLTGSRLSGHAHFRVHFPSYQFHWNYVTCYRDAEARDGIGLPGHHHCGDSSLTVAEYKSYLG